MKKLAGFIGMITVLLLWSTCAGDPAVATSRSANMIVVEVPKNGELQVYIKTADNRAVTIRGSETEILSAADEGGELDAKVMQRVKARGTKLLFTGAIVEFDITDNGTVNALDVSACPKLEVLRCSGNQIKSLDLITNNVLRELYCGNNQISALNLKVQKNLAVLHCEGNLLRTLNLTAAKKLTELRCSENAIQTAEMDALLKTLPMRSSESSAEARIHESNPTENNQMPSADAIQEAEMKGWKIHVGSDQQINEN
ncbi:leucine-rich repeat domain-containing protein [Treponema phagedenis]|uniref:leucine-rich repeat domain-containing protein n=1 Tax=Treponema phagedenis TaxID=162 RepID=UPI0001F63CF6|nr:leucine-rich repeat domain-containing protein [Treponema phagedenis]EFW37565.1 hypothetical protein HMPREF9554_01936 [Treponema phagedenis F0421]TYT79240.1 leucine-rich repeat domain-containing protein [Treponema phagedenis]